MTFGGGGGGGDGGSGGGGRGDGGSVGGTGVVGGSDGDIDTFVASSARSVASSTRISATSAASAARLTPSCVRTSTAAMYVDTFNDEPWAEISPTALWFSSINATDGTPTPPISTRAPYAK